MPMRRAVVLVAAAAAAALAGTSAAAPAPKKRALVTWKVGAESFRTYLNEPVDIARVRTAIREGAPAGIPVGRIYRGSRENRGHRWHLRNVRLADVTIELCDGLPSYLDADLEYWIGTVKRYCPWSAVPVRLRWVVPQRSRAAS
jgi:hypothetical protein